MPRPQPPILLLAGALLCAAHSTSLAAPAEKRVCVEVKLQVPAPRPTPPPASSAPAASVPAREATPSQVDDHDPPAPPPRRVVRRAGEGTRAHLPLGQSEVHYLQRLLEHFVTHEVGFVATTDRCEETLRVELYPLVQGWTAFARYTGNGREERIDQLYSDELSQFAERAALALLHDVPISTTIRRDTVLRADSLRSYQRIRGTHHFVLALGTQVRLGRLAEAKSDGSALPAWRVFSPMSLATGYRGKFETWAVSTMVELGIGTSRTGIRENRNGGHLDLGGTFGIGIHFLRYTNPRGIGSFYLGAGSTFEVLWFSAIKPAEVRGSDPRSTLVSGGLDVDLLCGYEFMRASSVQFFLQGGLQLPAYAVRTENEHASINTWLPGLNLKMGVAF
jgi:hypothetical protein